ncbi:helix-turn-helix domain-containing protein [Alloalcanivorax sp. C16-2]|uniref:helix-turn-helix domain-containing protein n=1 Tax=Alloalcanivorax TaxID=3020832 RepID=UPI0019338642|nr:helix-turn-helix transcriptional regulator [Alloalcanivorax marinus]MBL7250671.1 helix-turn-helix transcriptional regulator [Alloalcanivorax marinus]
MTKDLDIGGLLRERRLQQGKTLKQVASRAHTDPGNLSRIERNEQQLSVPRMLALCDALNWKPEEFVRRLERRRGHHVGDVAADYNGASGGGLELTSGDRLQVSFTARLAPGKE